ncbi:MAG: DEAD/DEAH box helicase [Ilumatobacteraceae bacterium]
MRADRSELTARYTFTIDRFQHEAFDALDAGRNVVVAAPTGSGKTVVAEYGVAAAIADGRRAFYTAPIKALSNQKFRDLAAVHGADRVGLLTGDNAINADAPIVVMTTEVLRNMIYAASRALRNLGLVVLDEVHFLQDTYRGPVWEEVIIHLPSEVRLVCLSATVSNVADLADWISTARGPTDAIVETKRPVPLENRYLAADRTNDRLHLLPMFVDGGINRDALRLDESAVRSSPRRRQGGGRRDGDRRGTTGRRKLATPGRVETVEVLDRHGLLPAIVFIFSRAQCDAAARACLDAGVRLTTDEERRAVREIVDGRLGGLDGDDLEVLGFRRFVAQLEAGVAAHHAGMVPPMKEVVEACFVQGLAKVVFATETLAVGINMPARSVVIEKLTKFTGDHHERLTPGEYTQLTGRAGRRGIDERGDAVVLWSPWVRFDEVAELAASSSFHLRSAFRPTYNMAANLIRNYGRDDAHHLLNLSFAQYQADRDVVRLEARLERRRAARDDLVEEATSPYGEIAEYRRLRDGERDDREAQRMSQAAEIQDAVAGLRPGALISVVKGKHRGSAAVIATAHRKGGIRLTLIGKEAERFYATVDDFDVPPYVLGRVEMPPNFAPNRRDFRQEVARRVRKAKTRPAPPTGLGDAEPRLSDQHPVAQDPDLRRRMRAFGEAERLGREIEQLERRVRGKNQSISRDFDRVLDVLDGYGYVEVDAWELTELGEMLARIFHESDLLVAEIVQRGLLDDLAAPDLAALVSTLIYEHRSPDPPPAPWFSSKDVRRRWRRIDSISGELGGRERAAGLAEHRPPDPTFAAVAHAWVAGEGFAEVVGDEELTGGDFVRNARQLIDLLRQLALVAPVAATRRAAGQAAEAAFRGVVADSAGPMAENEVEAS